jgi:hypothetical protein
MLFALDLARATALATVQANGLLLGLRLGPAASCPEDSGCGRYQRFCRCVLHFLYTMNLSANVVKGKVSNIAHCVSWHDWPPSVARAWHLSIQLGIPSHTRAQPIP